MWSTIAWRCSSTDASTSSLRRCRPRGLIGRVRQSSRVRCCSSSTPVEPQPGAAAICLAVIFSAVSSAAQFWASCSTGLVGRPASMASLPRSACAFGIRNRQEPARPACQSRPAAEIFDEAPQLTIRDDEGRYQPVTNSQHPRPSQRSHRPQPAEEGTVPSIAFSHANGLYLPLNREDRQQLEPEVPTLTTEQVERLLFGKNDSTQAGPIAQDPSTRE